MKLPRPDVLDYDPPVRLPGVHALKQLARAFERDLIDCEDCDQLMALVLHSKPLIARIQSELPDWWDGRAQGDETRGLEAMIQTKTKELTR